MILDRRSLLLADCFVTASELAVESKDTPFFEHFHVLNIPLSALINPPADGAIVTTSPVDQGSFDQVGFQKFIASSGLNAASLQKHDHPVKITREQLVQIARGEKDVEIRVISKNGNYVHNFLVTASPMILAKIRKLKKS